MANGLSISDVVAVTINLTPSPVQFRNFGTLLIAGSSDVIDVSERIRVYTTLSGIEADFGINAPETLAATIYFGQSAQPNLILVGRWAQTATSGVLHGGLFNLIQQQTLLAALQAITTGAFTLSLNGTPHTYTALDFHLITNLNGAASIIQTALAAQVASTTCKFEPDSTPRFNIESGTTGTSSTVSYMSTPGSGTDISALLKMTAASGASPPVAGIAAESALQGAVILTGPTQTFGCYAFGFAPATFSTLADSDVEAVAGYIEALSPSHSFWAASNEAAILDPASTTDLASVLTGLEYNRTYLQYSSSSPYCQFAAFAKFAVIDPTANNSMITLKFQTETGVFAETITETQAASLNFKNCNVFVNYATPGQITNTVTAILQQGVMCSGQFADTIWGADWLQNQVQTDVFNLLRSAGTKIAQTPAGMNQIQTTISNALQGAVTNGWAAPGQWNAQGFGQLANGQFLPTGYYVYTPPLNTQAESDRAARKATVMQCAVKLAGAVHSANVIINVNP